MNKKEIKKKEIKKKAVVLLSGGLDSTTTLYYAKDQGYEVSGLIFYYGQRHQKEIKQAQQIAKLAQCPVELIKIALPWQGSALLDKNMDVPKNQKIDPNEIPVTYVPGRNIIFLSFAASYAETIGAQHIFIGANAVDYSGYPDCRPEFLESFEKMLAQGLKTGVKGKAIKVKAPLVKKTKAQIIKMGLKLGVPYDLTWSCYSGGRKPCGECDSCILRQKGFDAVGINDPAIS